MKNTNLKTYRAKEDIILYVYIEREMYDDHPGLASYTQTIEEVIKRGETFDVREDESKPFGYHVNADDYIGVGDPLSCSCCFEIGWRDKTELIDDTQTNLPYVVCIDKSFVRDTQVFDSFGINDEDFTNSDWFSSKNENRWNDISAPVFICVISADSEEEAVRLVAEKNGYDPRCLLAIPVHTNN